MTQVQGRGRATALPLEERSTAIVAATLPLFLEQGANVTTREIAQAAGIAEGTIFRVFADKSELLAEVFEAALDTAPTNAAIAAIGSDLPFEEQLVAAVEVLRDACSTCSGCTARPPTWPAPRTGRPPVPALIAILEQASDRLVTRGRAPHASCADSPCRASTQFAQDEPLTSDEIVTILLHGALLDGGPPC